MCFGRSAMGDGPVVDENAIALLVGVAHAIGLLVPRGNESC